MDYFNFFSYNREKDKERRKYACWLSYPLQI